MLCSGIGCGSGEQWMRVNEHASSIVPDRVDTTKCETNFMMVVGWTSATLTMECWAENVHAWDVLSYGQVQLLGGRAEESGGLP